MLIPPAQVLIRQIKIRLLCDRHAGMSEDAAQCVNVHPVHQAAFGKIITQAMGRNVFVQPRAFQVMLEKCALLCF